MTSDAMARDWQQILARRSFLEGDALDRATALLDPDGVRVLVRPVRPPRITMAGAPGHRAASRRRRRHRPRNPRRPPRGDRVHRTGLPGRRDGRGVGREDQPGAALAADASRAGTPTAAVSVVRDRRRPTAGSQPRSQRRRRNLFGCIGSAAGGHR